jgi:hypothetical protein
MNNPMMSVAQTKKSDFVDEIKDLEGGEKGSLTHCWWECELVQ